MIVGPTPCGGWQGLQNWAKSEGEGGEFSIAPGIRYYGGCRGDCRSVCLSVCCRLFIAPPVSRLMHLSWGNHPRGPRRSAIVRKPYTLYVLRTIHACCVCFMCARVYTRINTRNTNTKAFQDIPAIPKPSLVLGLYRDHTVHPTLWKNTEETAFLCPNDSSLTFQNFLEEFLH